MKLALKHNARARARAVITKSPKKVSNGVRKIKGDCYAETSVMKEDTH